MSDNLNKNTSAFIHKEGLKIILYTGLILFILNFCLYWFISEKMIIKYIFSFLSVSFYFLVVYFFRVPRRAIKKDLNHIISPADGKIVVIEKTFEDEYFNDYRMQVSIFMSPLNVHVNWSPVRGIIKYIKYHPGTYLVAWKPKASEENERYTTVFKTDDNKEILMRQIAGKLARRIISYAVPEMSCQQGEEIGIIKFGSRVDLFLPLDTKLNIQLNQKVKGTKTIIAEF